MRDCPGCKLPLANDAICCNACGWNASPGVTERDPNWDRCVHEDRGERCANVGNFSPSTTGTMKDGKHVSGPWFCRQHLPARGRFVDGVYCPPPMGFAGLRAILSRSAPKPFDFEAEAERMAIQQEAAE